VSGYVFHCTPCGFAHAGECDTRKPMCETCPAGFCHGKLHHVWVKRSGPQLDLVNDYQCSGCKRTLRRTMVEVIIGTPTEKWAGPCLPQS
jgi:hypothetical protein